MAESSPKHCGKRRNCLLQTISPFSTVFEGLILNTCKNKGLFVKGLKSFKPPFSGDLLEELMSTLAQHSVLKCLKID